MDVWTRHQSIILINCLQYTVCIKGKDNMIQSQNKPITYPLWEQGTGKTRSIQQFSSSCCSSGEDGDTTLSSTSNLAPALSNSNNETTVLATTSIINTFPTNINNSATYNIQPDADPLAHTIVQTTPNSNNNDLWTTPLPSNLLTTPTPTITHIHTHAQHAAPLHTAYT